MRLLSFVLLFAFSFSCKTPDLFLPENLGALIEDSYAQPVEDLVIGHLDSVKSEGGTICYERIGDFDAPLVVLVMGFSNPALKWQNRFVNHFIKAGFQVIRFDNRDVGNSSWTTLRKKLKAPYLLSNMANDIRSIVNKIGVEEFHLIGSSMGGMVAQAFAIQYPERLKTLTSLSSTGFYLDPLVKTMPIRTLYQRRHMNKLVDKDSKEIGSLKKDIAYEAFFSTQEPLDDAEVLAIIYRHRFSSEYLNKNPNSEKLHRKAVVQSGSRLKALKNMEVPTLLIHGQQDPLIHWRHSLKLSKKIPNNELILFKHMGHNRRAKDIDLICPKVLEFIKRHELKTSL